MTRSVYDDKYFTVAAPDFPLNSREDGGHFILLKKQPVSDRSDLGCEEAIDFMRVTMVVGRAMYDVLGIERMNYQDLGNWGLDEPGGAMMHLHFFRPCAGPEPPDPRRAHLPLSERSQDLQRPPRTARCRRLAAAAGAHCRTRGRTEMPEDGRIGRTLGPVVN
jgi:hypothetical protein